MRDKKNNQAWRRKSSWNYSVKIRLVVLKDCNTKAYVAFNEFHKYKRGSDEDFADFIRFEHLYSKLLEYHMVLPEAAQMYFLQSAINMSEDNDKTKAMSSILDYTHTNKTTMKIFRDPSGTDDSRGGTLTLKEKCFYENARNQ